MKVATLLPILCCVCALQAGGCRGNADREIEITRWEALHRQEPSADAADRAPGWKGIAIPSTFVLPYPPRREIQYLWLRGAVDVSDPDGYHGISLGRIYYVDRVYVNRRLVGAHLTADIQDIHFPRNYEIPPGVLKRGENRVLVHLGIYGREYGGLPDRVRLMSRDHFIRTSILHEFVFRQLPIGILILFFGQIVFIILRLAWKDRDACQVISLAIFVVWISYLLALFSPYYPFGIDFRITLLWSCACIAPILFFLYIQYYYKVFVTILNMTFIPILIIFAILCLVNQDTTSPYYLGRELGMAGLMLSIPMHFYLLVYISRIRPGATIVYFFLLGFLPAMVIVWDIVNYLYVFHTPPLLHIYTLPAIVVLFASLRVRDTMRREVQLEILYEKLRGRVGAARRESDGAAQGEDDERGGLTPAMEEKLRNVIDFLRDNYLSDISREGLAKAIDLSPDHMSRKFKLFTGYRISDYINRLRIEEASRQLLETDRKIIDIAFSVGFESLVTFNRAFLKVKDITPSEFRKRKGGGNGAPA